MSYNEWLDIDVLEDYLDGKLDAKTMHKVERLSLEDPFVAEALAGLSQSPKRTYTLSLLQKQLEARIAEKPIEEKRWRITSQRLSIAAAAAVLFITVSILFWMKGSKREMNLAQQNKEAIISSAPEVAKNKPRVSQIAPGVQLVPPVKRLPSGKIASNKKGVEINERSSATAQVAALGMPANLDSVASPSINTTSAGTDRKIEMALAETQVIARSKVSDNIRERQLAGKAAGIRVETNHRVSAEPIIVNGKVFDKSGGSPLPGAIVRIAGTNKAAVTDKKGEFVLPIDSSTQQLSVNYLGFNTKEVRPQANQPLNIALEANSATLDEVVIPSVKEAPPAFAKLSAYFPLGGWGNYLGYLASNNELREQGATGKSVKLRFEVKANGEAQKIVVLESLGKQYDAMAIKLLKEGPKWLPITKDRKGFGILEVQF